ncbi:MAG: nucleotidyltransferase [Eubacteriales bacterium]|nr:nucleotidyltransferase [Eubacteriales bacterium]
MGNNQKTTLVIMAAGIGSRYGGVKQLDPVGPNGELIISYSVYDAVRSGYDKIIIVLRHEIKADFDEVVGNKLEILCKLNHVILEYAYQDIRDLPDGIVFPEGRTKPWGTCQALLACRELLDSPFAVINSDDYYDRQALSSIHNFLVKSDLSQPEKQCMVGYQLLNTLSASGGVTRGICKVDSEGMLSSIRETHNLKERADGEISFEEKNGETGTVPRDSIVSMNIWGFMPSMIQWMEEGFSTFLKKQGDKIMENEFLIPDFVGDLLEKKQITVRVLPTSSVWYGMTYKQDHKIVADAILEMVHQGIYPENIYRITED